jgi:hypothetical protein
MQSTNHIAKEFHKSAARSQARRAALDVPTTRRQDWIFLAVCALATLIVVALFRKLVNGSW